MQHKVNKKTPYYISIPIIILIALGPIYWFQNGLTTEIKLLKYIIFLFLSITAVFSILDNKIKYPDKTISICFSLAIIITIINGFRVSEISSLIDSILTFTIPFFILIIIYNLENKGYNILNSIESGAILFSFFTIPVTLNFFTGHPNWLNPFGDVSLPIHLTGLGGSRTGWGIGCSLILPVLFKTFFESNIRRKALLLFLIISVIISIFSTAGRGGIICSSIIIVLILSAHIKKNPLLAILLFSISISTMIYLAINFAEMFRLEAIIAGNFSDASTGRATSNEFALDIISNNIIIGLNPDGLNLKNHNFEFGSIHNLWLNTMIEGGLLLTIPILFIFIRLFFLLINNFLHYKNFHTEIFFLCTFITGIFFSMIEPKAIFGQFFNTISFWMLLAIFIARTKKPLNLKNKI